MADQDDLIMAEAFRLKDEVEETLARMENAWEMLAAVIKELRGLNDPRVEAILNRHGMINDQKPN